MLDDCCNRPPCMPATCVFERGAKKKCFKNIMISENVTRKAREKNKSFVHKNKILDRDIVDLSCMYRLDPFLFAILKHG